MIKFVLILTSVVSLNFAVSFTGTNYQVSQESMELIFSNEAVAVESGQPVYPSNTKVWLSSNDDSIKEITLLVNENEAVIKNEAKIDLSEITTIESGTYTLVVNAGQESTFGFTIQ